MKDLDATSRPETADRAARVAAMLDRWEAEDVSGEPEWNIEDIGTMTLGRIADHEKKHRGLAPRP